MKRFVLAECAFFLVLPLFVTACWPFDLVGGGCQPRYVYDQITDEGRMLVVTDHEQTGNNTGRDVTQTLTAEKSTTVTVSAGAGVDADLGAIISGVRAQLHVDVSKSVTASITNSPTITIPDGATGYGDYGVFVQLASGHLYSPNCGQDYGSHVPSSIPLSSGWCVWVTGESADLCKSGAGSSITYPNVAGQYHGTIHNTRVDVSSNMTLSVTQNQGDISGDFTVAPPLLGNGPFTGAINTAKHLQFIVHSNDVTAPILFQGTVMADGSLQGEYCSVNQQNQCDSQAGGNGTWDVSKNA